MGEGGAGPQSERVSAGGWSLEDRGAGNDVEQTWLYPSGAGCVRIALVHEGRGIMRAVPCEVLAHVLRVQGYDVAMRAEAAE